MSARDALADLLYSILPVDHDDETLVVGIHDDIAIGPVPSFGDAGGECKRIADAILAAGWRHGRAVPSPDTPNVLAGAEDFPEAVGNLVWRWDVWVSNNNSELGDFAADVRRIADAYPPPARTVSTAEELTTVPAGWILRSKVTDHTWWRETDKPRLRWTGSGGAYTFDEDFIRLEGPLFVIHKGGA